MLNPTTKVTMLDGVRKSTRARPPINEGPEGRGQDTRRDVPRNHHQRGHKTLQDIVRARHIFTNPTTYGGGCQDSLRRFQCGSRGTLETLLTKHWDTRDSRQGRESRMHVAENRSLKPRIMAEGNQTFRVILNRADQIPYPKEGERGDGTPVLRSSTLTPQPPRLDREADLGQREEQAGRVRIPRGRTEHLKGGGFLL